MLIAVNVFRVVVGELAEPVAALGSVKFTVAVQLSEGKVEDASVACAKYCRLNVVVVLIEV